MSKILIVEDESGIRSNIREILELAEFETVLAEDGFAGLKLAEEHRPDLIVCDLMLPEQSGYEVLARLRQHPSLANTPFIFLTARAGRSDMREGMKLGADDYMTKPFEAQELLEAVNARLALRKKIEQPYARTLEYVTSKLVEVEQQLGWLANRDPLTGLPNRNFLQQQFDSIRTDGTQPGLTIPLLVVNLDNFTRIVDNLGHGAGNNLLISVAERLASHFPPACEGLQCMGSLGGDRFAFLLQPTPTSPTQNAQAVEAFARKLLDSFSLPFFSENCDVFVRASIGVVLIEDSCDRFDIALERAIAALRHAQKSGGDRFQFYTSELLVCSTRVVKLEADLHYALRNNELAVFYQPQVDLQLGRIVGVEALVRWQHPEFGAISPGEFIPLAEENGLIADIDLWVFQTACLQLKRWQAEGIALQKIAVNLSAMQFRHARLIDRVRSFLEEIELDPRCIELEITESTVVRDVRLTGNIVKELRALGISVAIDDFGTGYSSLSYLKTLPFDLLKADRSFVRNIHQVPASAAILKAILSMSETLNFEIVAEGVETAEELQWLQHHGCKLVQGYLFGRPLPAIAFAKMYRSFEFAKSKVAVLAGT